MLGILCGLESEAKIARKVPNALVACAAARPGKARELARGIIANGATCLMSFGIAGALHPSAKLGEVFVGTRVVSASSQWTCDDAWGTALAQNIKGSRLVAVYGSESLVATAGEKAALATSTGGIIVDMESQCAAEIAAEKGIPFTVVRAVCDDAHMNVPPIVMATIAEDGSIDILRAITHLARRPAQFGDLFYVLRGTSMALSALRETVPFLSNVGK